MKKNILFIFIIICAFFQNAAFCSQDYNTINDKQKPNEVIFAPYIKEIQKEIKLNWHPATYNSESKKAVALFKVQKNGTLLSAKILKSSGQKSYDDDALAAIYNSAPFKPFPQDSKEESLTFQFNFDYNVRTVNSNYKNQIFPNSLWFLCGMMIGKSIGK